jgi:mono/diheme cytochrome c family protein
MRGIAAKWAIASLAAVAVVVGGVLWVRAHRGPDPAAQWALVESYCVDCHNDIDLTGELSFEGFGPEAVAAHPQEFETAVRKLRGELMPPPGNPRPSPEATRNLIAWLESELDAAPDLPRAGHVPVQRLSRSEYAATVRDLLAVEIDPAEHLPTEMEIDGFTNMAAALSVSPAFLEQYVAVARRVARLAVGEPEPKLASVWFPAPEQGTQDGHTDGLPLGTRGGTRFTHIFPADGEYHFTLTSFEILPYARSLETEHTVLILIDREEVFRGRIGGLEDIATMDRGGAAGRDEIMQRFAELPIQVTAGPHEIAVTFIERAQAATDTHIHGFVGYGGFSYTGEMRVPRLKNGIQIVGPYHSTGVSHTPGRDRIFVCTPEVPERELACARQIAAELAERAFRRPVDADDIARLMPFFEAGRAEGGHFDVGVEHLVAAVLASPDFLYRTIRPAEADAEYALSDLELASRLSFFLWRSNPDEALRELAIAGELSNPAVLAAQTGRMLRDPRARSLVTDFALPWLNVDDLDGVDPDEGLFPQFNEDLREDFATEIELFLASILLEDRNVEALLTAEHSFVNDRLAEHYGIDGIYGPQFRELVLADTDRHGLLGKAAVLMRTSYGNRTSPVLRGAWVLETLLGTPPTPPPPDVETDLTTPEGEQPETIRARLEQHREAPNCNGCHGVIDPWGIALENFTVLGEWRDFDRDADAPIDAATTLPSGTTIEGPVELREAILARQDQFVQALTGKLMMYALGRELEYHDMPQVRRVVREAADDYRFASIVTGIVASDAFRMQAPPHEE